MYTFSVIIPTFNENNIIRDCVCHIKKIQKDVEIIIVDGGSTDNTVGVVSDEAVLVYSSPLGRGTQCNYGAKRARGSILLFLHADTKLPFDAFGQINNVFKNGRTKIATFRMKFDFNHWLLQCYEYFTRFDSIFTLFGDQCIVVRKSFFEAIGGFPDWPLFEDVRILQKARGRTKIVSLPGPVITSARKFIKNGLLRQQIHNGIFLLRYLCGASPHLLAREYSGNSRKYGL
ncbi:MAG: TIGR04283 family arsenosugar biosynthesis glycosyltransferase [Candidatus Omnitrophota bacterium]|nr:MAG: TIGR04283 family arsenosugar biosynthesis glycosyltransferase [Candidatus Omnitrophota bacterium]